MERSLPIENNVILNSYTYYSFLQAIAANEYRIGKKAATVKVGGNHNWSVITDQLSVSEEENVYSFWSKEYGVGMNALLYRKLEFIDEQELEVLYYQFTAAFSKVSFCILGEEPKTCKIDQKNLEFGVYCREEIFLIDKYGNRSCYPRDIKNEMTLCMQREGNKYDLLCLQDDKIKKRIEAHTENGSEDLYICILIDLEDNAYFDWLYQNFIQLKYNKTNENINLEFDLILKRYWKYFTTNYLVDYSIDYIKSLHQLGIDAENYIKTMINNYCYIEMDLDSYDISGTSFYHQMDFLHTCLIYGYSDEQGKIFLLSVDEGRLKKGEISYSDFKKQFMKNADLGSENNGIIIRHTYNPDPNKFVFSLEDFVRDLKCYLNGKTVICADVIIRNDEEYSYGMHIYDELLNDQGIKRILNDIRITAVLREHKYIMKDRFHYLFVKNYVSGEIQHATDLITEKMNEIAKRMQLKVIHNIIRNTENKRVNEQLCSYLKELRDIEKIFYPIIIKFFEKEISEEDTLNSLRGLYNKISEDQV